VTEGKHEYHLWYTRRDGEVLGPFPETVVQEHILVGRGRPQDELSRYREEWTPLSALPELIPEVMRHVETEEDEQRLLQARMRADERRGERRHDAEGLGPYRRSGDRRGPEDLALLRRRGIWPLLFADDRDRRNHVLLPASLLVVAAIAAGALFFVYVNPPEQQAVADCTAPPGPQVNWSYCHLEGVSLVGQVLNGADLSNARLVAADLSRADLRHARLAYAALSSARLAQTDLRGADLRGAVFARADLSGARLDGADLSYANLQGARIGRARLNAARLDRAIWTDGRVCAAGSVGECR
jgi:hypothetical protein